MRKTTIIVIVYAIAVLIGGIVGYCKAASLPSLISGSSFGLLLLLSALIMHRKKEWGYWMAFFLSVILQGFFTWRFAKSLNFFPAGFLSFVSLFVIIILALTLHKQRRR